MLLIKLLILFHTRGVFESLAVRFWQFDVTFATLGSLELIRTDATRTNSRTDLISFFFGKVFAVKKIATLRRLRRIWIMRISAVALGVSFSLVLLEVFLRIVQPFPTLVSSGRLELPVNAELCIERHGHPGLDDPINVRFNSLGLRGPEPTTDDAAIRIITVGGSTTQCFYLTEGKTWPDRLAQSLDRDIPDIWVNNAGMDGHSTFGHLQLLDHLSVAHPDLIVFYVGINDIDRVDLNEFDVRLAREQSRADDDFLKSCYRKLVGASEIVTIFDAWRRHRQAAERGLTHFSSIDHGRFEDAPKLNWSDAERESRIQAIDTHAIGSYASRLRVLVKETKRMGAHPVLMTQAVLFGDAIDPITKTDLSRVRIGNEDGYVMSLKLDRYNQVTRDIARDEDVLLIDLAAELPKSSEYYYDWIHNNNQGATAIGDIVASHLETFLSQRFPGQSEAPSQ